VRRFHNAPEDVRQVVYDFLVAESQHPDSMCFQEFCPFSIAGRLLWVGVNTAIHLDFKLILDAEHIEQKAVVGVLPPEF